MKSSQSPGFWLAVGVGASAALGAAIGVLPFGVAAGTAAVALVAVVIQRKA